MGSALYGIYALVRFLIRQQLVRKYRTPALSMKFSLSIAQQTITSHLPQSTKKIFIT